MSISLNENQIPADVNEAQWKAITHKGKHLLIVAGPGTGKTHTLTYRIIQTIQQLKRDEKVLAITFTNKAALEMQERLSARLKGGESVTTVGTFHSFCLEILRRYPEQAGLPKNFRVALPTEIQSLAKDLWPGRTTAQRKELREEISRWKASDFRETMPKNVEQYNTFLRQHGLLDFDDLLWETLKLLEKNEDALKKVRQSYRFIFVDEYQDINAIQHALLKILIGNDVSLTAIGDPNQAIYGFRGSNVQFFDSFQADFPDASILSLENNYRSASNLLMASGQVIEKGGFSFVPNLTAQIYQQGRLTVHASATDKAEAEYVVHQIEKMVGGTSMFSQDSGRVEAEEEGETTFGDIAVLYRLNSQRNKLKKALERSGIPYQIHGEKSLEEELLPQTENHYEERTERVYLLTIHAAKGLEFPVVFMVGCEENLLPLNLEGLTSDVNEERRLFYVGMTRAKHRLYLIRSKRRLLFGKSYQNAPSPFLADIEEKLKAYEKQTSRTKPPKPQQEDKQLNLFKI